MNDDNNKDKTTKGGFWKRLIHLKYKKYIIVLALGVLIVGFLGENSVVAHLRNQQRIDELRTEINHNISVTHYNQEQLHRLQTDSKTVEHVGRERYFMKRADEDVFILSDDDSNANMPFDDDETVE